MTGSDRERWDERYTEQALKSAPVAAVDPFVATALERLGPGAGRCALDLAAGGGRQALEVARAGWRVAAWDVSPVGLALLERRARSAGLAVQTRCVDLAHTDRALPAETFELVIVVNFLERSLLPRLQHLVQPGGHVLFATFTVDRSGTRPPLEFCLAQGELAGGLPGFETLVHEEAGGRAGLLGRRP